MVLLPVFAAPPRSDFWRFGWQGWGFGFGGFGEGARLLRGFLSTILETRRAKRGQQRGVRWFWGSRLTLAGVYIPHICVRTFTQGTWNHSLPHFEFRLTDLADFARQCFLASWQRSDQKKTPQPRIGALELGSPSRSFRIAWRVGSWSPFHD